MGRFTRRVQLHLRIASTHVCSPAADRRVNPKLPPG